MKELSIIISIDKIPYLEKACKDNLMKIKKVTDSDYGLYEVFIEYNPAYLEIIFSELFYAGAYYGLNQK